MKKNRKTTKRMSVMAATTMRFGSILIIFFIMVILNMLASSRCSHLLKLKGERERELARLNDSHTRESTRWEEMKTPDNIETALLRHGMRMLLPRHDQNVYMNKNGQPRGGQLSVAKAAQRVVTTKSVKFVPVSRKRRTVR